MPDPQNSGTLTLDQLSALTLLTISELQGPAKAYLPKPKGGFYHLTESVKGAFRFYSELRARPVTVDKDELRTISGLSDQRHRQLANEGHFQAPIKGRYDLRSTAAGLIRYFKELHQRRDKTIGQKRERKIDNENELLEIEIAEKKQQLVSVDEMVARLTPACSSIRQIILSSTLTDDERDQLIEAVGSLLDNALKSPIPGNRSENQADTEPATSTDGQPVGG